MSTARFAVSVPVVKVNPRLADLDYMEAPAEAIWMHQQSHPVQPDSVSPPSFERLPAGRSLILGDP